jgi:hypothetical protein
LFVAAQRAQPRETNRLVVSIPQKIFAKRIITLHLAKVNVSEIINQQ